MVDLGGYRLVRMLGSGRRADVYLGHPLGSDGDAVAIKRFRAGIEPSNIGREVESLSRVSSRHVVTLRDITRDDGGRQALILDRHGPSSLAALLRSRPALSDAEAVTALAPIVGAVGELHRVGVAHGGIGAGSVIFDRTGAPVLIGFGFSEIVGDSPPDPLQPSLAPVHSAASPAFARDRAACAALVRTVLECDGSTDGARETDRVDGGERADSRQDRFIPLLVDRIFDLAPAASIDFGRPEHLTSPSRIGARGAARSPRPGIVIRQPPVSRARPDGLTRSGCPSPS